jgi:hypothetical protein
MRNVRILKNSRFLKVRKDAKRDCKFKQLDVVEEAEGTSTIPWQTFYLQK